MLYAVFGENAIKDIKDSIMITWLGEMEPEQAYIKFYEEWWGSKGVLVEYDKVDGNAVHPVAIHNEQISSRLKQIKFIE